MKKLIGTLLAVACLFSLAACSRQTQANENAQDIRTEKTYAYEKGGFGGAFSITLKEDGTFTYTEGGLSSYFGSGSWTLDGDILRLSDKEGAYRSLVNCFQVEEGALVFLSGGSTNFSCIQVSDGERFIEVA